MNGKCVRRGHGDGLNVSPHLAGLLITALGFLLQRAQHDFIEPHIHLNFLRRRGEAGQRQFTGEHFVKDNAQGINVRAVIHELRLLELFRRHVVRCSHHFTRLRQPLRCRVCSDEPGQAEVGDFYPPRFVHQDVLGLDVAMDDALVMRILKRFADLRHDGQRLARLQLAVRQQVPQRHAIDELHQEVVKTIGLAEIVNGHDVRMVQTRQRARLAREPLGERWVPAGLGGQNLHGHQAVELLLPGLIHRAHAALADEAQDFQLREPRRKLFRRGRDEPRRFGPERRIIGRISHRAGAYSHFHEAFGAKTLHGFRPERLAAVLTDFGCVHDCLSPSTTGKRAQGSQINAPHDVASARNRERNSSSTSPGLVTVCATSARSNSR